MVQPPQNTDQTNFDKGKEEFRRSMRKRENVDLYQIRKQRLLEQQKENEKENAEILKNSDTLEEKSDGSCRDNLKRFSRILETPYTIVEYKDLLKSLSMQFFSKSNTSLNSARSAKYTPRNYKDSDDFLDRRDSDDDRTTSFVLTQKFIGWKV